MRFDIITIFPQIFGSYFGESILKRAQQAGAVEIAVHNLRDYSTNKHKNVDDTPYGGGAGMVMQIEPVWRCVTSLKSEIQNPKSETNSKSEIQNNKQDAEKSKLSNLKSQISNLKTRTILFSAKGKRYTQEDARRLAQYDRIIMICGRYEGVDERVAEYVADEELSIGDYVLTGGEIPAMVVVDSVARLLPGVLGNEQSAITESHAEEGYLEHPQYTKPESFNDWKVPEILLSGNHEAINKWREQEAEKNAKKRKKRS